MEKEQIHYTEIMQFVHGINIMNPAKSMEAEDPSIKENVIDIDKKLDRLNRRLDFYAKCTACVGIATITVSAMVTIAYWFKRHT